MSRWSGVAEAYRSSFGTMCAGSIDRMLADTGASSSPGGGDRSPAGASPAELSQLDAGCGTGALAERAETRGRAVTAVDLDPEMVRMARARIAGTVHEGSVQELPFEDDAFDVVTANFLVNHVPDPRAAMAELRRVMRPGGRAAMTIWPAGPTAWRALVGSAFEAAGVQPLPPPHLPEHLDFERSTAGLHGIAEGAGFRVLAAQELTWTWQIEPDALWEGVRGGVATPGRTYLAQVAEVQRAADRAFRARAAEMTDRGPLRLPVLAAYVLVTKDTPP